MAVTIKYGSSTLATVDGGQTATINCEGQKMEGNVVVDVPETPSAELVKGSITVRDTKDVNAAYTYGFIQGMNWALFLETVGDASGAFGASEDYPLYFGYPLSYNGVPALLTDLVIDGAEYLN